MPSYEPRHSRMDRKIAKSSNMCGCVPMDMPSSQDLTESGDKMFLQFCLGETIWLSPISSASHSYKEAASSRGLLGRVQNRSQRAEILCMLLRVHPNTPPSQDLLACSSSPPPLHLITCPASYRKFFSEIHLSASACPMLLVVPACVWSSE